MEFVENAETRWERVVELHAASFKTAECLRQRQQIRWLKFQSVTTKRNHDFVIKDSRFFGRKDGKNKRARKLQKRRCRATKSAQNLFVFG